MNYAKISNTDKLNGESPIGLSTNQIKQIRPVFPDVAVFVNVLRML